VIRPRDAGPSMRREMLARDDEGRIAAPGKESSASSLAQVAHVTSPAYSLRSMIAAYLAGIGLSAMPGDARRPRANCDRRGRCATRASLRGGKL
jgi:hypothetical protein